MKILKLMLIVALGSPMVAFAQKTEIPGAVTSNFSKEYDVVNPETNVNWVIKDDKFIAKFKLEDKKSEITYNSNGLKLESLVEISKERLKHYHYDYVKENYPKAIIFLAYLQNSEVAPERMVLDIIEDGKTTRLYFRPDGTFFQEVKL
jgi:hypothetical protein